ncbi:MAG TPA: ATP-dependent DNA ligase [Acetobacteraceae bacterium]|nr:ATP-dependent DNA ligase [Acetobacteraceae bacterium]
MGGVLRFGAAAFGGDTEVGAVSRRRGPHPGPLPEGEGGGRAFPLGLDTEPMEARAVEALPQDEGWQFEPKWDGFRCLAFKSGDAVELRAKSGKPLGRYFPEMVAALKDAQADQFVLDGELTICRDGVLAFDALQDRLHPAESRIRKLAAATPAQLILFDCLASEEEGVVLEQDLPHRRAALERVFEKLGPASRCRLTTYTRDRAEAQAWLDQAQGSIDGVVAKRLDAPYRPGERAMLKIKHLRTADCVVGGFRYAQGTKQVGSLLLGLFNDEGKLDHVGFTSAISDRDRPALTKQLEALRGPPGFTGAAPGGPSRWSTERSGEWEPLRLRLVLEVRYDHVTGNRFRHGTSFVRWRPDKDPHQCRMDQLRQEAATNLTSMGHP